MAECEVLQHVFPEGVAQQIMRFHSHPLADMLRDMIDKWEYYRELSEGQQLDFAQYWQNARTLEEARGQYLYNLTRTTRRWKDYMYDFDEGMPLFVEHMTFIPGLYEVVADDEVESVHTEDIEEVEDE
jgi:hypothetical protein